MFGSRLQQEEILDSLDVSGSQLSQAMDGLSTLNRFLGNKSVVINSISNIVNNLNRPIKLIDLGCGVVVEIA